jgi:hypothetical protein
MAKFWWKQFHSGPHVFQGAPRRSRVTEGGGSFDFRFGIADLGLQKKKIGRLGDGEVERVECGLRNGCRFQVSGETKGIVESWNNGMMG